MFSGIARRLSVFAVASVLVGTCLAEEAVKTSSNALNDGSSAAHRAIFLASDGSQIAGRGLVSNTSAPSISSVSIRPASSEELVGMEQTLNKYRTGFESFNLNQIREAWPGLDRHRASSLKDVFAYLRSSKVPPQLGLECAPPTVTGDSANVKCRETLTYSDAKGRSKDVKPAMVSIQLKKQSDAWVVDTMRGLGKAE